MDDESNSQDEQRIIAKATGDDGDGPSLMPPEDSVIHMTEGFSSIRIMQGPISVNIASSGKSDIHITDDSDVAPSIEDRMRRLERKCNEMESMKDRMKYFEKKSETMQDEINEMKKKIIHLLGLNEGLEKKVAEMEKQAKADKEEINRLCKEIAEAMEAKGDSEEKLEEAEKTLKETISMKSTATKERDEYKQKWEEAKKTLAETTSEKTKVTKERDEYKQKWEEAEKKAETTSSTFLRTEFFRLLLAGIRFYFNQASDAPPNPSNSSIDPAGY